MVEAQQEENNHAMEESQEEAVEKVDEVVHFEAEPVVERQPY